MLFLIIEAGARVPVPFAILGIAGIAIAITAALVKINKLSKELGRENDS